MSRCTLSGCVVKFETPLRLNTSLLLGLRKHASAELPGGSCEYHGDLPFFFLQEVVGKPCGSGVSAWPVTGELLTIHIIERSQAG